MGTEATVEGPVLRLGPGRAFVVALGVAAWVPFAFMLLGLVLTNGSYWSLLSNPSKPKAHRWVPVDEDIHGWSPFVLSHPACFDAEHGVPELVALVDESHRFMRQVLRHRE